MVLLLIGLKKKCNLKKTNNYGNLIVNKKHIENLLRTHLERDRELNGWRKFDHRELPIREKPIISWKDTASSDPIPDILNTFDEYCQNCWCSKNFCRCKNFKKSINVNTQELISYSHENRIKNS